jgi:hypothetical protein
MMLPVHYVQGKFTHLELPNDLPDNLAAIRQMQQNDRALMDKVTRAFVSYKHFYVKHECSVLLELKVPNLRCALILLLFDTSY